MKVLAGIQSDLFVSFGGLGKYLNGKWLHCNCLVDQVMLFLTCPILELLSHSFFFIQHSRLQTLRPSSSSNICYVYRVLAVWQGMPLL